MPTDLERVSADLARVVVILAPAGDPEAADRATLRAVLALRSFEAGPELGGHIVAEARDAERARGARAPLARRSRGSRTKS